MMSFQSSSQDLSLEEEKAKKEGKPSSSHLSTHPGAIQTKKNRAMTYRSKEKWHVEVSSGRRLLDKFSPSTTEGTTVLANKISCHTSVQLCAGRLHLQSDFSKRDRILDERLSTPRLAPKMVLKSVWQSQQQQQQQLDASESSASGSTRKLVRE